MGKKLEGAVNLVSQLEKTVDFKKPLKKQIDQKFTVYKGVVVRRDSWRGRLAKIFEPSEKEEVKILKTEKLFADAIVYLDKRKHDKLKTHKDEYHSLVSEVIRAEAPDLPAISLTLQTRETQSAVDLILHLESIVDFEKPLREQIKKKFTVYKGRIVERDSWKGRLAKWFDSSESEQTKHAKAEKLFSDAIVYLSKKNPQALQNHEETYRTLLSDVFHLTESDLPASFSELQALVSSSPELKTLEEQKVRKKEAEKAAFEELIKDSLLRRAEGEAPVEPMTADELDKLFEDAPLDEAFLERIDSFVAEHPKFKAENYENIRNRIAYAIKNDLEITNLLKCSNSDQERQEYLLDLAEELEERIAEIPVGEQGKQLIHFGYGSRKDIVSNFFKGAKPLLAYLRKLPAAVTEGLPEPLMRHVRAGTIPSHKDIAEPLILEIIDQAKYLASRISDETDDKSASILFSDPSKNIPASLNIFLPKFIENFRKDGILLNVSELLKDPTQKAIVIWLAKHGHQLLHKEEEHEELFKQIEESVFALLEAQIEKFQSDLDDRIHGIAKSAGGSLPKEILALFGIDASLMTGPLWLEFEKRKDGTFALSVYTLGATLNNHSYLADQPNRRHIVLNIEDIPKENISSEFFYRLLLKHYEPLWNSEATSLGPTIYSQDLPLLGGKIVQPEETLPTALISQTATPANLAAGQLIHSAANPADPLYMMKLIALVRYCKQYVDPDSNKLNFPNFATAQAALKAARKLETTMKKHWIPDSDKATLTEIIKIAEGVKEIHPNPIDNMKLRTALKVEEKLHQALGVTFDQLDNVGRTVAWAIGGDEGDLLNKVADEIKTRFPAEIRDKARGGIPLKSKDSKKGTFRGISLVTYLNLAWKIALGALAIAGASMGGPWMLLGAPCVLAMLPYVLPKAALDWYKDTLAHCLHHLSRFVAKSILFLGFNKKQRQNIYDLREEAINWLKGGRFQTQEYAEQMYLIPQDPSPAPEASAPADAAAEDLEAVEEPAAHPEVQEAAAEPAVSAEAAPPPAPELVEIPIDKKEKIRGLEELSGFCPLDSMICQGRGSELVSIAMPEQNLHFNMAASETGPIANSVEFPGFHIAKSQYDKRLGGLPGCLILESNTGKKKVLIKRNQWIYSALGNITTMLGEAGQYISRRLAVRYGGTSRHYYEYDMPSDPKAPLGTEDPAALTYLMIHAMLQNKTKIADQICSKIEGLLSREPVSETMLDQLFPLLAYPSISPELVLIRTRIFAALGENLSLNDSFPSNQSFNPVMSALILITSLQDLKTQSKAPNPEERLSPQQEFFLYKFNSHMMKLTINQLKLSEGIQDLVQDFASFDLLMDSPLWWQSPVGKRFRALQKEFEIPGSKSSSLMRFVSRFAEAPGGLSWIDFNLVPPGDRAPVVPPTSDEKSKKSKINKLLTIPLLAQTVSKEFEPLIDVGELRTAMAGEIRTHVPLDIRTLTPEALKENFATYYALMREPESFSIDNEDDIMGAIYDPAEDQAKLVHTLQVKAGSGDETTQKLQSLLLAIAKDPSRYPPSRKLLKAQKDPVEWKEFFKTLEKVDAFDRLCNENLLPLIFETLLGFTHTAFQFGFVGSGAFHPELRAARIISSNEFRKRIPNIAEHMVRMTSRLVTNETNTDFRPFLKKAGEKAKKHKRTALGAAAATSALVGAVSYAAGSCLQGITERARAAVSLMGIGNLAGFIGGLKVAQMRDIAIPAVKIFNPFHMIVPHIFDNAGKLVYMFLTEEETVAIKARPDLPALDITEVKESDQKLQDHLDKIFEPLEQVTSKGKTVYKLTEESIPKIRNELRALNSTLADAIKKETKGLEELLSLPIEAIQYRNERNPDNLFPLLPEKTDEAKKALRLALLRLNQKQLRHNLISSMIEKTEKLKYASPEDFSPIIQELGDIYFQSTALEDAQSGTRELEKMLRFQTETSLTLDAATNARISQNLKDGTVSRAEEDFQLEPLIAASKANGQTLAISIFSDGNPTPKMQELSQRLREIFGIASYSPRFDRNIPVSIKKLESIYVLIRGIAKSGDCLQLTQDDLLNLRGMFLERLEKFVQEPNTRTPESIVELVYLHKILKFIYLNGAPVLDEKAALIPDAFQPVDMNVQEQSIGKGRYLTAKSVIERILKAPDIKTQIENMRFGKLSEVPAPYYEAHIKPGLVTSFTDSCAKKFKLPPKKKEIVSKLLSGESSRIPPWLDNKLYDTVMIYRSCILNFPRLANSPPADIKDQSICPLERYLSTMIHAKIRGEEIHINADTLKFLSKNIPSNTLDLAGMFQRSPAVKADSIDRIKQVPRQQIYEKILACDSENFDDWCSVFTYEGNVLINEVDPLIFKMESNDPYELHRDYTNKFAEWSENDRRMLEQRLSVALNAD